jgi:WD40 repeat protein
MSAAEEDRDPATLRPEDGGGYDAFVSYQRNNLAAVERMRDALRARGHLVWMDVDYDNIPAGTHWEDRIKRGIEACKAFIFVISEGSKDSAACGHELAAAVELQKLIIPIVHQFVQPSELPESVAQTQWIDLRDDDRWDAGIDELVDALENDVEWRDEHTRYAGLAREWLDHNREGSYVLRGSDLRNAEAWLTQQGGHREQPTNEQHEYIAVSRHAAVRRQRALVASLTTALVITIALAVFALIQRDTATHETHVARAQLRSTQALLLASTAARLAGSRLDQSLLLALEANRLEPSLLLARTVMTSDLETVRAAGVERLLGPGGDAQAASAVAYSPSGELLATGGVDGFVRLYDLPRHKLVATLPNGRPRGPVNSMVFAPNGATLATGSSDGKVRLFTVSPDKLTLVSAATANTPSNLANQISITGEYGYGVESVAFAPSGKTLAVGSRDGKVRLFSASGRNLRLLDTVSAGDAYDSVTSVAFAPSGAAIAAGIGSGFVRLVGVSARGLRLGGQIGGGVGQLAATPTAVTSVAFAPRGTMLAAGGEGGTVQLIGLSRDRLSLVGGPNQIATGNEATGADVVDSMTFGQRGTLLATGTGDGRVRLFGISHLRLTRRGLTGANGTGAGGVNAVAFAPDGAGLAAAGNDGLVREFAVADGRLVTDNVQQGGQLTSALAFSPAGNVLAVGDSAGKLQLFRVADGELTLLHSTAADSSEDQLGDGVVALAFDPRGTRLAAGSGDGKVRLFAVSDGFPSLLASATAGGGPEGGVSGIALEAKGSTLVASSSGARVRLFTVSDRRLSLVDTAEPAGRNAELLQLASAPDTGMVVLEGGGEPVLATVSRHRVAPLHAIDPVANAGSDEAVALSADGRRLAVAADNEILLYRISQGKARLLSFAPTTQGYGLAFAPNGRTLAVGTQGHGVVLFAITGGTLTELLRVTASGPISNIDFSPDGTELAFEDDVGVHLLNIVWPDNAYLRERVCGLVWRNLSRSEWSTVAPPGLENPRVCPG